jgi:flagellar basal body-associated protein FliL
MSDEENKEEDKSPEASEEVTEVAAPNPDPSDKAAESESPNPEEKQGSDKDEEDDEDLADALNEEGAEGGEATAEDLDKLLIEEDPLFQDELSKINADDFADLVISSDSVSEDIDEEGKGPGFWKSYYNNLPKEKKLRFYISIGIVVAVTPIIALLLMGKILPTFEIPYVVSMNELTEEVYSYPTDGVEVPLFDDFRSQAVTFGLPKTMINLKRENDEPAYGEFEFFLNLREKELTEVIKAKQSEIMDLIQRTLEQITWRELQTPVGKEKVKKVIRHRVNDYLQGNIVLGVYYRSILLQK